MQLSLPSYQVDLNATLLADPIKQLSDEFGFLDIKDVQTKIFAKTLSLRHENERKAVDNYFRAFAYGLLLKLQNLRNFKAATQEIEQIGLTTLKELETSSYKMIQEYQRFQTGSKDLEDRYSQFDAKIIPSANNVSLAAFSDPTPVSNPSVASPLMNVIGKYMDKPNQQEQPSVLENVLKRVNRIAGVSNDVAENDPTKNAVKSVSNESSQNCVQNYMRDKAMQNAVAAKVTASTLEAVGYVVKETAAHLLGCRGEGKQNCQVVLGYVKTGAEKVEEGVKHVITVMGAKPAIKRMVSGKATTERLTQLGMERENSNQWFEVSAEQFVKDCNTINVAGISAVGAVGAFKLFRTVFPSRNSLGHPMRKGEKENQRSISKHREIEIEDVVETVHFKNEVGLPLKQQINKKAYYLGPESSQTTTSGISLAHRTNPTMKLISKKVAEFMEDESGAIRLWPFTKNKSPSGSVATEIVEKAPKSHTETIHFKAELVSQAGHAPPQRTVQAAKEDRSLLKNYPPLSLPNNFPRHMAEFHSKQRILGKILYQVVGNDILLYFPTMRDKESLGKPSHAKSLISAEKALIDACLFAKSRNYGRIFMTWDPLVHSLESVASKLTSVVGVGQLSRGEFYPFVLIEIQYPQFLQSKAPQNYSPDMQKILVSIDEQLGKNSIHPAGETIRKEFNTISELFPDYTDLYHLHGNEQVWMHVIRSVYPNFSATPSVLHFLNTVVKIYDPHHSFIVKEIGFNLERTISEFKALDFLHSLQLNFLELPDAKATGKYRDQNRAYHFIIKTCLEGKTLNMRMQSIGNAPLNSNQRDLLVSKFVDDLVNAGKALGEFQSKGLLIEPTSEGQAMAIEGYISEIDTQARCAHRFCGKLGITLPEKASLLGPINQAYRKCPGSLSYGFIDYHGDQFVISKNGKLGLFDVEMTVDSFDGLLRPMASTAHELATFVSIIDNEGIPLGFTRKERTLMKNAIKKGYDSEFRGTNSSAATTLFEVNALFKTIGGEALDQTSSATKDLTTLRALIGDLEQLL